MSAPEILPADVSEAAEIAALINRAYRVEDFFINGDRTTESEVGALLTSETILVARDVHGRIEGCVRVSVSGERGSFGMLAVEPDRHRAGLGRALIRAAEAFCAARSCTTIELSVVHLRTELIPWYRRLGFQETGTAPFAEPAKLRRPAHFILMSRDIGVAAIQSPQELSV